MHAMDGVTHEKIVAFRIKGDSLFLGITLFKLDTQKRRGNFPLTTVETKLLIDFFCFSLDEFEGSCLVQCI